MLQNIKLSTIYHILYPQEPLLQLRRINKKHVIMQGHANTIEPYSYLYYYIELVKLMKTYRRNYREDGMNICRQVLKVFADREQKKRRIYLRFF